MRREDFENMWFEDRMMFIEAPKEVSTCRSKGPKCELLERTYDHVIASQSLEGEITCMEVVEDFESSLHKAVSSVIERDKEVQEWKKQKMPKVLPGFIGGRLPWRSTAAKGREEEEKMKKVESCK